MSADDMAEAVQGCMEAACHEWSVERQQQLLATAVFGRAFAK